IRDRVNGLDSRDTRVCDRHRCAGSYQGRTCTTMPITYASVAAVETVNAIAAIHVAPGTGLPRRDTAAGVAAPLTTPRIRRVQYHRATENTAARIRPTA